MKKKIVVIFGILYIILLILNVNVVWIRFGGIWIDNRVFDQGDYEIFEFLTIYLYFEIYYNNINSIVIVITIFFIFTFKIRLAKISGILGTVLFLIGTIIMFFIHFNYAPYNFPFFYIPYLFIVLGSFVLVHSFLIFLNSRTTIEEENRIKKLIIEIGSKFTVSQVQEISEKSKIDKVTIVRIIKRMIENKEIKAEYFKSSKTVAFYQNQYNVELDALIEKINKLERRSSTKKV